VNADLHSADGAGAEAVQPFGAVVARLWTTGDQVAAGVEEQAGDLQTACDGAKEIYGQVPTLLGIDEIAIRLFQILLLRSLS
jgi:hypothetical protein